MAERSYIEVNGKKHFLDTNTHAELLQAAASGTVTNTSGVTRTFSRTIRTQSKDSLRASARAAASRERRAKQFKASQAKSFAQLEKTKELGRAGLERLRARNLAAKQKRFKKRVSSRTVKRAGVATRVTTSRTGKGIGVGVTSRDPVVRELALQRVQKEESLKQEKLLRESRRESAKQAAKLQRKALEVQIQQRGINVGREKSRLKRETRIARARSLSRSAGANVTGTSAFKASRIASRSGLQREIGRRTADESRNKLLDQIRSEEIEANLQARIAENPDPINVFLEESKKTTTFSSRLT